MISGCLRASDSGSAAPKMELGSRSGGVHSRGKGFSHCLRSWQNFGPLEQQELNTKLRETPCPDLVGGLREKTIEGKTLHFCCSQFVPFKVSLGPREVKNFSQASDSAVGVSIRSFDRCLLKFTL